MTKKTILLVEDNPDDELFTVKALRENNIINEIIVARNGMEALDYLFGTGQSAGRDLRELPQLVLLDLQLPKVDGREVLRRIRADARTRTLPVVILTSSKEESDLVATYQLGCNSFIRKPVNFEQFAAVVHQLKLYWLVLNEPPPNGRLA